jgi:hypothetical protein
MRTQAAKVAACLDDVRRDGIHGESLRAQARQRNITSNKILVAATVWRNVSLLLLMVCLLVRVLVRYLLLVLPAVMLFPLLTYVRLSVFGPCCLCLLLCDGVCLLFVFCIWALQWD